MCAIFGWRAGDPGTGGFEPLRHTIGAPQLPSRFPQPFHKRHREVSHVFYWIYDIPTPQLAMLISGIFVGFYWIGCFLIRPVLRTFVRARSGTNDIVGYILSCFGVFLACCSVSSR